MAEPLFHVFVDDAVVRSVRTDDELLAHLHGMEHGTEYHITFVNTFGQETDVGGGFRATDGTWNVRQVTVSTTELWTGITPDTIADVLTLPDDD